MKKSTLWNISTLAKLLLIMATMLVAFYACKKVVYIDGGKYLMSMSSEATNGKVFYSIDNTHWVEMKPGIDTIVMSNQKFYFRAQADQSYIFTGWGTEATTILGNNDVTEAVYITQNLTISPIFASNLIPITGISLSDTAQNVVVGETQTALIATITPANANQKVTWSSANTNIATVDLNTGNVTGVAVGRTTITATSVADPSKSASYFINVIANAIPVTSITISPTTYTLKGINDFTTLIVTVNADATNKNITWSANPAGIVSLVDNSNGTATIRPINITPTSQSVTITATSVSDALKTATATIIVEKISVTSVSIVGVNLSPISSAITLTMGKDTTFKAVVVPDNASFKDITWTSSNNNIISVDNNGNVHPISPGTATITATADGVTSNAVDIILLPAITVDQNSISLLMTSNTLGTPDVITSQLNATTVIPSGTAIAWTSDNTSIATVSSSGLVTAVNEGNANITASITVNSQTNRVTIPVSVTKQKVTNITIAVSTPIGGGFVAPALPKSPILAEQGSMTITVSPNNAYNKRITLSFANNTPVSSTSDATSYPYSVKYNTEIFSSSHNGKCIDTTPLIGNGTSSVSATLLPYWQSTNISITARADDGSNVSNTANIPIAYATATDVQIFQSAMGTGDTSWKSSILSGNFPGPAIGIVYKGTGLAQIQSQVTPATANQKVVFQYSQANGTSNTYPVSSTGGVAFTATSGQISFVKVLFDGSIGSMGKNFQINPYIN